MKYIKKIISIMLIILLCTVYLNIDTSYASSTQPEEVSTEVLLSRARGRIALYAEAFCRANASKCRYNWNRRGETYLGQVPNSRDPYFYFDCVGWTNFAINRAIGIDYEPAHRGYNQGGGGFVVPNGVSDHAHFGAIPLSSAERGDILYCSSPETHVAIYLGNGRIVDMWDSSTTLGIRNIDSAYRVQGWTSCRFTSAARLISLDGNNVDFGELPDGIDIGDIGDISDLDAIGVDLDNIDFKYSGMPKKVTNAGGHSISFYIDKISDAFDYLIGIIFNGIKVVGTAIVSGIEGIISNALDELN